MDLKRYKPTSNASRWMRFAARSLRLLGVITIFLSTSVVCMWSQTGTTTASPFATLNASLEQSADGVLASSLQASTATNPKPAKFLSTSLAIHYNGELRRPATETASSRIVLLRPVLDPILRQAGIPTEFAAVVLVESGVIRWRFRPEAHAASGNSCPRLRADTV